MSTNAVLITSPWTPFGLRDDPFFQAALDPSGDERASHPITLFVGRDAEVTLIGSQIVGSSSSRAIITGAVGVGKTSLVSRIKAVLAAKGTLTHTAPVRVVRDMPPRLFEAEVLRVLLQMRAVDEAATATSASKKVAKAVAQNASLTEAHKFWRRVGRLVEGEDSVAGGLTIASVGAQREQVRIPAEVGQTALTVEVAEAFVRLSRKGARNVLIHVNNMENLTPAEAGATADLMQQVRDTILSEYAHWIFVGATGIESSVFGVSPQVSSIVPLVVPLPPLTPGQVGAMLERRYQHLRLGMRFTPPVDSAVAVKLYRRFRGDLRGFLNLLGRAVQRHAVSAPGVTVSEAAVLATVAPTYKALVVPRRLSGIDLEHLERAIGAQKWDTEFRVSDLANASEKRLTPGGASKLVQRLLAARVVGLSRSYGRSTYYQLFDGEVSVALALT